MIIFKVKFDYDRVASMNFTSEERAIAYAKNNPHATRVQKLYSNGNRVSFLGNVWQR